MNTANAPATPGPSLERFSQLTRAWFQDAFAAPTAAQAGAWAAIAAGQDALVVAPTGSGKTLAAHAAGGATRGGRPAGPAAAAAHRRHAHRRHPRRGTAALRAGAPRHPDHHARVAVPAAHLPGQGGIALPRHGDRRRGPFGGRHQAWRPPGSQPGTARRPARAPGAAHRPVRHGPPAGRGGPLPRRRPAGHGGRPAQREGLRPVGGGPGRGPGGDRRGTRAGRRRGCRRGGGRGAGARRDLAAHRGASARTDPGAPLHHRVRQLAPPRRTALRQPQRARRGGDRPNPPWLGQPRAARPDRGGPQGGPPAGGGCDQLAGARHRHGHRRPGGPGGGSHLGGTGPAADRPGGPPGRRHQPRHGVPEVPRRPGRVRGGGRADAERLHRGAALPSQPAGRARAADRRHGGAGRLDGRAAGGAAAALGALRGAAPQCPGERP